MAVDKLVDSTQLDADLASVADAIRTKGGTSAQLAFPAEFVSAIEDIETGGGYVAADWLDRSKPTATYMESAASSTELRGLLYGKTGRIERVRLTAATSYPEMFLTYATGIGVLFMDEASSVGGDQGKICGCQYFIAPKMRALYSNALMQSTRILLVDFGGTPGSGEGFARGYIFSGCTGLKTIILRGGNVWPLNNINIFNKSPFASGKTGGTLYVPQALISTYQSATNWSTILGYTNNQILPIEGSIYETQYGDGTPIPTA